MPNGPKIFVTYDIVTEESAADGDTAERGYYSGGYHTAIPDGCVGEAFKVWCAANVLPEWEFDPEDMITGESPPSARVRQAAAFLRREGFSEHSSGTFFSGGWYSWADSEQDMRTGDHESRSAHLEGFTPDEERGIYTAVVARIE